MAFKVYKMDKEEFEKASKHRPRILRCLMGSCLRRFPDKQARDKHMKDKHTVA